MDRDRMTALFKKQFELCKVKEGETMVLLSDPEARPEYITASFAAAKQLGAKVFNIAVSEAPAAHLVGVHPLRGLDAAVDAMKKADIVIAFTRPLFTKELREIMNAGTRVLMVIDHPDDLEMLQSNVAIERAVKAAGRRLERAREVRYTSDAGTDLRIKTGEYPVMIQYGYADEPGRFDHGGVAVVHTFPNEGSANGRVVINVGDMVVLPFKRYVQDRIDIEVRDGFIRKIEGGFDAMLMRDWLEGWGDQDGYAISHLGWGLHPKARWNCIEMFGPARCVAHGRAFAGNFLFSTGPNTQGGGKRTTPGHYDAPMRDVSVFLDGEQVIDRGRILAEDMKVPQ
jgi:2,5-dihydroxypyridine 5,6-dioxygenase